MFPLLGVFRGQGWTVLLACVGGMVVVFAVILGIVLLVVRLSRKKHDGEDDFD